MPSSAGPWRAKSWIISHFLSSIVGKHQNVAKHQKLNGGEKNLVKKKFRKMSHKAEKTERVTFWDFSTSIMSQNMQKLRGGPLGENFLKKVLQCRKKIEKGDSLVSPGMTCYTGEQEKNFLVQFARPNGAI